jgi:hypothetical protein
MSMLDLLGLQRILHNGIELFRRKRINFVGGTVVEDAATDTLHVTLGEGGGGGGTGTVTGPESSSAGNVATWAGTGGTALEDSGIALADLATEAYVDGALDAFSTGSSDVTNGSTASGSTVTAALDGHETRIDVLEAVLPAGWQTAFDLDFASLPNQTIAADGAVTIGGVSFTAVATARSALFQVANGNGLRIKANNLYSGWYVLDPLNNPSGVPHLRIALAAAIPGFHLGMQVRIQVLFSSLGAIAPDEFAAVGLDSTTWANEGTKAIRMLDGYLGSSAARIHRFDLWNDSSANVEAYNTFPVGDAHRLLVLRDLVGGAGSYMTGPYTFSSAPAVFPAKSALAARASFDLSARQRASTIASAAARRWINPADVTLRLAAYNSNTSNNQPEGNFKRIKLEYRE